MNTTTFHITRHAETEANVLGIWQGHTDSPLTQSGKANAMRLGKRLARSLASSIDFCYSSDLGRAHETAKLITAETGHSIRIDPRLREINLGIFQGLTITQIKDRYPAEWDALQERGPGYAVPGAESTLQHRDRIVGYLEYLAEKHPGATLLIIAHGGSLNMLLKHTVGAPFDRTRRFTVTNCALNKFSLSGGEWQLHTWGDCSHLENLPEPAVSSPR